MLPGNNTSTRADALPHDHRRYTICIIYEKVKDVAIIGKKNSGDRHFLPFPHNVLNNLCCCYWCCCYLML